MNIQFMTNENAVTVKDSWTGKDKFLYVPDFEALKKHATCEEELEAIRSTEKRVNEGRFKGFPFQIVYMACALSVDPFTCEHKMKWQIMQHPWIRNFEGVYRSKEAMIEEIEEMYK